MESCNFIIELSERQREVAHDLIDLMGSEVLAHGDLAQRMLASEEEVRAVLSYLARYAITSFLTRRGMPSRIRNKLWDQS